MNRPPHLRVIEGGPVVEPEAKPEPVRRAIFDLWVEALALLNVGRVAGISDEDLARSIANWAQDYGDALVAAEKEICK